MIAVKNILKEMAGTAKIQRLGWSLEWMQRISEKGNENLGQLGYTDHSQKHCMQVAHHAEYGTLLANELLKETDMTLEDRVTIVPRFCSYCSCKTGRRNDQRGGCMPGDFLCTGICFPEKLQIGSRWRGRDKTEHSIKNLKAGEKSALRFFAFHSGVPQ